MSVALDMRDVERFRSFLSRHFGHHLDDDKLGVLAEMLRRRLAATSSTAAAYLDLLQSADAKPELRAVAAELSVPETYFFRNIDQFHAFRQVVLPARLLARAESRQLRILSVGCASGEEPYSLAILVREAALDPSWRVSITGVDMNVAMLARAARGRYSPWALRETPPDVQRRWFRPDGADQVLDDDIRRSVAFEEQNLAEQQRGLWQRETYDVVFWRNVMMYLTRECATSVLSRIGRALAPGGYLFLGHAETLRGLSNDFHLRHTHGTFYYQRRAERELEHARDAALGDSPASDHAEPLVAVFEHADSWVDAVARASQRIHALADDSRASVADATGAGPRGDAATAGPAARPSWNLTRALELLERERFAEAIDLVSALPAESARDPQVLLLHAALLTHSGQLARAEEVCSALIALDELDAGAHYLLALCREGAGDRRGAIDHDQVAVYLDPSFAMPRLHLGLLARRAGDRDGARRDLADALLLLQREDTSRLLLFGGGFGRQALVNLCRAELTACGGTP